MIVEEFPNHNCDVPTKNQETIDILWFGESRIGKNGRKVVWAKTLSGTFLGLIIHGEEEAEMIPYEPTILDTKKYQSESGQNLNM